MIAQSFRDWGRDCYCEPGKENTCGKRFDWKLGDLPKGYDHKYIYSHAGYNMKITDMQAACGLAQLDRVKQFIKSRKINFKYIYDSLKSHEEFLILPKATENSKPSWFGFPITLRDNLSITRTQLLRHLDEKKIVHVFRSQISQRFQKSHLENCAINSTGCAWTRVPKCTLTTFFLERPSSRIMVYIPYM